MDSRGRTDATEHKQKGIQEVTVYGKVFVKERGEVRSGLKEGRKEGLFSRRNS